MKVPDKDDAINITQAVKLSHRPRPTIVSWIADGTLDYVEYAGRRVLSKKQLFSLLACREKNPREWKQAWKEQKEKDSQS